jgi:chloramphenicol-sensitive protein RarD
MDHLRRGYLNGLGAYLLWGVFPIYFKALRPASPLEILAHRVIWSAVFVTLLLTAARRWRTARALLHQRRKLAGLALAAALIGVNWGVYIYGVNSSHVVESSLGYFINPLVAVLFGLIVFHERLRRVQWVAMGMGTAAVVLLTVDYGRPPWLALTLAMSFGSYALVKKRLGVEPASALLVESSVLTLPGLGYLCFLAWQGQSTFGQVSVAHTVLLATAGVVTAVPLLMFADAANRIPLTSIGLLQYITPIGQLLLGVMLYHEPMPPAQLLGFGLVWLALIVFTWEALWHGRRASRAARTGAEMAVEAPADAVYAGGSAR